METRKVCSCTRVSFLLFLIFGVAAGREILWADDILPPRAAVSPNTLVIKTPTVEESDRPAVYSLKRWVVEENTDPVKHALQVYKKKSESRYVKRVWLTGKTDGQKRLIVEYTARGSDDKVIFSPDEDFMYYIGLTPGGQSIIYGVNLLSNKKFSLGAGENFRTVNCPDQKSYVVVQPDGKGTIYHVFTIAGERMKTLTDLKSPVDIEKNLCH